MIDYCIESVGINSHITKYNSDGTKAYERDEIDSIITNWTIYQPDGTQVTNSTNISGATGPSSHIEGSLCFASGTATHAEGYKTNASEL